MPPDVVHANSHFRSHTESLMQSSPQWESLLVQIQNLCVLELTCLCAVAFGVLWSPNAKLPHRIPNVHSTCNRVNILRRLQIRRLLCPITAVIPRFVLDGSDLVPVERICPARENPTSCLYQCERICSARENSTSFLYQCERICSARQILRVVEYQCEQICSARGIT